MEFNYTLKIPGIVVYIFILEGSCTVNGQILERRDGYGIRDAESIDLVIADKCRILLMEVPMAN
jgi:redox-sensitive bicupin YhaK (pirin superfamily)